MSQCQTIRRKKRKVCIGDLDELVTLNARDIKGLTSSTVTFDETFTPTATVWAMVETVRGVTVFDATNTEVAISHRFYIRYDPTVTAQTWIEFDGRNFDIATVENLDERKEYQMLNCTERGSITKRVNLS